MWCIEIIFGKEEEMKRVVLSLCVLMLTMMGVANGDVPYVPGDPVADFTLNDAYGTPVSLFDFAGKVIVINFWADW